MNASSCLAILLVAGGLLFGTVCPSQAGQLVGGYSEASVTNTEVVAAAQFAVKALAAMPERMPDITLVEILSASQRVVAGMNCRLRLRQDKKVPLETIMGILRHADIRETLIYAPYSLDEAPAAMNCLDESPAPTTPS